MRRIARSRIPFVLPYVTTVLTDVTPIGAPVAPVATQVPTILTDVARFLPRGGRVASPQILAPLADVLMDATTVTAHVTAVVAKITPVATNFMAISAAISGLLRPRCGGQADGERQQRGDDSAVSHDLYLEKLESWLRRQVDERVNHDSERDRGNVTDVTRATESR